jgi:pimeloyl-ACP methyl ester carboxylesterase
LKLPSLHITGSGQPLVWLHGMLNSVESDSVYSLLDLNKAAEIATLIRYNACGKSAIGDYRWDAMTEQLMNVAESQKIDSMIIGGTSMGSVTALHFAVKYPEKVKALILATPPPAWKNRVKVKAVYKKIASKASDSNIPEFLKRLILLNQDPPDFFEQIHPGTRQRLQEHRMGFEPAYYSQIYTGGAASDLPPRADIAEIQVPTLIVATPDDENHPLDIARELNSLIKGSVLEIVSTYEEYLKFQKRVQEFILKTDCNNKL